LHLLYNTAYTLNAACGGDWFGSRPMGVCERAHQSFVRTADRARDGELYRHAPCIDRPVDDGTHPLAWRTQTGSADLLLRPPTSCVFAAAASTLVGLPPGLRFRHGWICKDRLERVVHEQQIVDQIRLVVFHLEVKTSV